jgi:hypothetical protein
VDPKQERNRGVIVVIGLEALIVIAIFAIVFLAAGYALVSGDFSLLDRVLETVGEAIGAFLRT